MLCRSLSSYFLLLILVLVLEITQENLSTSSLKTFRHCSIISQHFKYCALNGLCLFLCYTLFQTLSFFSVLFCIFKTVDLTFCSRTPGRAMTGLSRSLGFRGGGPPDGLPHHQHLGTALAVCPNSHPWRSLFFPAHEQYRYSSPCTHARQECWLGLVNLVRVYSLNCKGQLTSQHPASLSLQSVLYSQADPQAAQHTASPTILSFLLPGD